MDNMPLYTDKATVDVMCLFLGINVAVAGNGIAEFSFTNFESAISVQEGWQPSRSLLDCSQLCSLETDCCGLSYNRSGRLCCLVVAEQLSSIIGQSHADPKLYLNERCAKLYQEMVSSSTSTTTATPTKPSTRESTSSTATASSASTSTSTSTSTSASTSTSIPTTKSASTSLPTTLSTTKATSITTLQSISTTTSTPTKTLTSKSTPATKTQTTTSSPTTTTLTTTTTATTTTTTKTIKCDAHALICTSSSVYVLTEDTMLQYDDYTLLTTGAGTRHSLSSTLPRVSGTVLAGYEDSTGTIHIIADTVVSYSSDTFQFIEESTLADHFGTSVDFQVDATLLLEDTDTVYIFSGDVMYKASGGQLKRVALDNNGSKNPYRSNNFSDRPLSITAACEISSELHVFISNNRVYTFQKPEDVWYDLGPLIC